MRLPVRHVLCASYVTEEQRVPRQPHVVYERCIGGSTCVARRRRQYRGSGSIDAQQHNVGGSIEVSTSKARMEESPVSRKGMSRAPSGGRAKCEATLMAQSCDALVWLGSARAAPAVLMRDCAMQLVLCMQGFPQPRRS